MPRNLIGKELPEGVGRDTGDSSTVPAKHFMSNTIGAMNKNRQRDRLKEMRWGGGAIDKTPGFDNFIGDNATSSSSLADVLRICLENQCMFETRKLLSTFGSDGDKEAVLNQMRVESGLFESNKPQFITPAVNSNERRLHR